MEGEGDHVAGRQQSASQLNAIRLKFQLVALRIEHETRFSENMLLDRDLVEKKNASGGLRRLDNPMAAVAAAATSGKAQRLQACCACVLQCAPQRKYANLFFQVV